MEPALGTIIDNGVGAGRNGACPGSDPDCKPPGETPGAEPCGRVEGVGAERGDPTCAFCTLTFNGGNVTGAGATPGPVITVAVVDGGGSVVGDMLDEVLETAGPDVAVAFGIPSKIIILVGGGEGPCILGKAGDIVLTAIFEVGLMDELDPRPLLTMWGGGGGPNGVSGVVAPAVLGRSVELVEGLGGGGSRVFRDEAGEGCLETGAGAGMGMGVAFEPGPPRLDLRGGSGGEVL